MGCDVIFKLNLVGASKEAPQEIVIKNTNLESGDINLSAIAELLKDNKEQHQQLQDALHDYRSGIRSITNESLDRGGIVGNTTLAKLKSAYPTSLTHETSDLYNPNILLVKSLKLNGKAYVGRVVDGDGNEVFVLTERDLPKFNEYLRVRDEILKDQEVEDELKDVLAQVKSLDGFSDIKSATDLLLDFQVNVGRYSDLEIPFIFSKLNDKISKYSTLKFQATFDDEFTTEIFSRAKRQTLGGGKVILQIPKKDFVKALRYVPGGIPVGMSEKEMLKDNDLLGKKFDLYFVNNPENDYIYKFRDVDDTYINVYEYYNSFEQNGVTFSTIQNFKHEVDLDYLGYEVFSRTENGETIYYCSLDGLSDKTIARPFKSIQAIRSFVDKQYTLNNTLKNTGNIGFKRPDPTNPNRIIDVFGTHPVGSIVKSLDLNIGQFVTNPASYAELDAQDAALINKKTTLAKFLEEYKTLLPKDLYNVLQGFVDTTEKAAAFLYMINDRLGDRNSRDFNNQATTKAFLDILNEINTAPVKYYYILDRVKKFDRSLNSEYFEYKVIPVSGRVEVDQNFGQPKPIIGLLYDIADLLKAKFNVNTEILHSSEIEEKFGASIPANAKAWVRDGVIYINGETASTLDLFHEYTHLLLGVLKSTDFDLYQTIMDRLASAKNAEIQSMKRNLKAVYGNLSDIDLNEEVFASLFAKYLAGKDIKEFFNEMKASSDSVEKSLQVVLGENKESLSKIAFHNLANAFSSFSKLTQPLSTGIEFTPKAGVFRRSARIIEQWIESKQLEEHC